MSAVSSLLHGFPLYRTIDTEQNRSGWQKDKSYCSLFHLIEIREQRQTRITLLNRRSRKNHPYTHCTKYIKDEGKQANSGIFSRVKHSSPLKIGHFKQCVYPRNLSTPIYHLWSKGQRSLLGHSYKLQDLQVKKGLAQVQHFL